MKGDTNMKGEFVYSHQGGPSGTSIPHAPTGAQATENVSQNNSSLSFDRENINYRSDDFALKWVWDLKDIIQKNAGSSLEIKSDYLNPDRPIKEIREQLAECQAKTWTWKKIHSIADEALEQAREVQARLDEMSKNLQKCTDIMLNEFEIGNWRGEKGLEMNKQVHEDQKRLTKREACMKEAFAWEKLIERKKLTGDVETKVLGLLIEQYEALNVLEKELPLRRNLMNPEDRQKDLLSVLVNIYTGENGFMIVGPVGERPLHICSLLASKFANSYDFEGEGNFISEGIINAMKKFIEDKKYQEQIYIPYGKDYCAAIGAYLESPEGSINTEVKLPYLTQLKERWKKPRTKIQDEMLITGLYEGETILHPRIADGDEKTVNFLLSLEETPEETVKFLSSSHEKGAKGNEKQFKSLTCLPARGLFFRPMYKEWLASASLTKAWHLYGFCTFERIKHSNLHASFDKSYFGMGVLSFAASQGNIKVFDSILRAIMRRTILYYIHKMVHYKGNPLEQTSPDGKGEPFHPEEEFLLLLHNEAWMKTHSKGSKPEGSDILTELSHVLLAGHMLNAAKAYTSESVEEETSSEKVMKPLEAIEKFRTEFESLNTEEHRKHEKMLDYATEMFEYASKMLDKGGPLVLTAQHAIVNAEDDLGNTLLHLAAWNSKKEMYDLLVKMGADQAKKNRNGLSPFTLTARFGIWDMFKHIWDRHSTDTIWTFGNVTAKSVDYSQFDWRSSGPYSHIQHIKSHIDHLLEKCFDHYMQREKAISKKERLSLSKAAVAKQMKLLGKKLQERCERHLSEETAKALGFGFQHDAMSANNANGGAGCIMSMFSPTDSTYMSAIRLITLFRPPGWFANTKKRIEDIVLHKWFQGYSLVFVGDIVLPYCIQVAIFGFMWSSRKLNVLEHTFWWSSGAPIVAEMPENIVGDAEAACGWPSILHSYSGRLQLVMVIYSVPSLLRLAWVQIRLRPTDLDEDEDMVISLHEMINFIYLNLESLIDIIVAALFLAILAGRIAAGEECAAWALGIEKASTAVASLFLFFNILVVLKAFRNMGLLLLSIYRFMMLEIYGFLLMYCIFFAAFILALYGLQRAERAYLFWMQTTETIIPQIRLKQNWTYLSGENIPGNPEQLLTTETVLQGCDNNFQSIADVAFSLLEVSMGDGFADTLMQTRSFDFDCAGLHKDTLSGYIIVFWVILTHVLTLNLLIASMSYVFLRQMSEVDAVWLLDISYRVMQYEIRFPQLSSHIQSPKRKCNFWTLPYYIYLYWNILLVLYCLPEIQACANLFLAAYRKCIRLCGSRQKERIWESFLRGQSILPEMPSSVINELVLVESVCKRDEDLEEHDVGIEFPNHAFIKLCDEVSQNNVTEELRFAFVISYLDGLRTSFTEPSRGLNIERIDVEEG